MLVGLGSGMLSGAMVWSPSSVFRSLSLSATRPTPNSGNRSDVLTGSRTSDRPEFPSTVAENRELALASVDSSNRAALNLFPTPQ